MIFEESISISAPPEKVFNAYSDVSNWQLWDKEVESSSIVGEFAVGSEGMIKPKGAPKSKITLIEVTENQSFTIECWLPLCKMQFIHLLEEGESSTNIINKVVFSVLLAPLFGRLIGKGIAGTLPASLAGLKNYVESKVKNLNGHLFRGSLY